MKIKFIQIQKFIPWLSGILSFFLLLAFVIPAYVDWQVALKDARLQKVIWEEHAELESFIVAVGAEKINRISSLRPEVTGEAELLVQLQDIASKNNLSLELVGFKINDPSSKKLEITESLGGTYENFKNYLRAIERNSRLVDIVSISFSSPRDGGRNYIFNITANTYFR